MGIFSKLTEGTPQLFRTKECDHSSRTLGKEEGEAEGWGKKPDSTHEDYWSSLLIQVDPARGFTRALKARGDLQSRATETMKEA
jgi:hypothetical protein